jgi:hypothetical protein
MKDLKRKETKRKKLERNRGYAELHKVKEMNRKELERN